MRKTVDYIVSDGYICIVGTFGPDMRVDIMRISYKKLWMLLIEKDTRPAVLRKDLNIATGTMTKLRRNEEVALSVLLRICEYLDCNIGDICDVVREEKCERKQS